MYVGSGGGGGYDQMARLVARHLNRFLPGRPNIVVANMEAAGGIVATNFVYNSAPKDGSVILADANSALADPIYNSPVAHYDPRKFEWIGSTGKQQAICDVWKASGIKTLDDAKKREVTVSANAVNTNVGVFPTILNDLLGTKFKVIAGYTGQTMQLAVERGEVEGLCGYSWQSYQAIGSKWFAERKVNVLVQMGLEKAPDLPDVPLARDLLANSVDRQVLDLIVLPEEFGRPFVAPPGTPGPIMTAYRSAFSAMIKDPSFLADAKKQRLAIEPLDAGQIEDLLAKAYAAPKAIHKRAAVYETRMN